MRLKGVGSRSFLGPILSSVVRVSNEMAPALRFQVHGLEQISGTRQHTGWGPDSSLNKCINIRVYTLSDDTMSDCP